jgi:hypothetical protein
MADGPAGALARSAEFSRCRRYRYALHRRWQQDAPSVLFIGLNPSTADARTDDATTRVCMNYARRWGYGGMVLANLFAWCATHPEDLFAAPRPVGPRNDAVLRRLQDEAALVVCAWGDGGVHRARDEAVLALLRAPHCLTTLRSGRPGHPLYKPATLVPRPL